MVVDRSAFCVGAAFLGLVSHLGWFINGEHDLYSRYYAVGWLGLQGVAYFVLTRVVGESILSALLTLNVVSASYLGALFTSILSYRLLFHPLRKFPGPLSWKATKLTQVVKNSDAKGYLHLDALHKQYGTFVRVGPNEISCIDPSSPPLVLGPGTKCTKALWYDIGKPLVSMHQCRDKKLHDIRRRIWDKGFNAKSLRDYEARVGNYTDLLLKQIRAFGGGKFNASKWFNYYSFDVMGDLAFGESFKMLETGEKHFAIPMLEAGMEAMNVIPTTPWLFYIIAAIPMLSAEYHKFIAWSGEQAVRRKTMKVSEPDIMSHLIAGAPMSTDPEVNKNWEKGDSRLIIVAGSDTTAATLTFAAYELIKNPKALAALREEVKPLYSSGHLDHTALQNCKHLNAIIDETLRLHPPVPSGLIRVTPPEGLTINGTYIPGNTTISLPLHSIQRNPEAYQYPEEFIPERWYSRPELTKSKGAFAPFSLGAMGCVGKALAYMEIRTVLTKFVTEFDFGFAPNEDGSRLLDETEDRFTLNLADLFITCTPRA